MSRLNTSRWIQVLILVALIELVGLLPRAALANTYGIAHVGKWTRSLFGGNVTHSVWHIRLGRLSTWPASTLSGNLTAISVQPLADEFNAMPPMEQEAVFIRLLTEGDPGAGIDSTETDPSHPDFTINITTPGGIRTMEMIPNNPGQFPLIGGQMNEFDLVPPFEFDIPLLSAVEVTYTDSGANSETFLVEIPMDTTLPALSTPGLIVFSLALLTVGVAMRRHRFSAA